MKPMKEPTVRYHEAERKIQAWDERGRDWRTLQTDVAPNCKEALWLIKSGQVLKESVSKESVLKELRRTKAVECYEAMGLPRKAAEIAASLERGVQTNDVNRIFEAGLALGFSEAQSKIFADPTVNPNPIPKSPFEQLLEEVKK
jgi:hypothetical protein